MEVFEFYKEYLLKLVKPIFIIIALIALVGFAFHRGKNPSVSELTKLYNAAVAFKTQGQTDKAIEKYVQILKLKPDFMDTKASVIMLCNTVADEKYADKDYNSAIYYAKKGISIDEKDAKAYEVLGNSYVQLKDYTSAIMPHIKVIELHPQDVSAVESLAGVYMSMSRYDLASEFYGKALLLAPNDAAIQQSLTRAQYLKQEINIRDSFNHLTPAQHAPEALYALVKPREGVSADVVKKTDSILDLIWSDSNGQILMKTLMESNVPIYIVSERITPYTAANTTESTTYSKTGASPKKESALTGLSIVLPASCVIDTYNSGNTSEKRMQALQAFSHEFVHAFMALKVDSHKDSLEEELGAHMLSYDISHKIFTGKPLSKEETYDFAKKTLVDMAISDNHKNLPLYSDFTKNIQSFGIILPFPDQYADIRGLYDVLIQEKRISPPRK